MLNLVQRRPNTETNQLTLTDGDTRKQNRKKVPCASSISISCCFMDLVYIAPNSLSFRSIDWFTPDSSFKRPHLPPITQTCTLASTMDVNEKGLKNVFVCVCERAVKGVEPWKCNCFVTFHCVTKLCSSKFTSRKQRQGWEDF